MSDIDRAIDLLLSGGVVALPTETVYGLAADATCDQAVRRIFQIKGRPASNPLIVHVADVVAAKTFAADWPEVATNLAEAFWPGPLTIVVPAANSISKLVTAGGDTVGLRVPNHSITLDVLRRSGLGLAMPSANRSNHVSPTTPQHVADDLGDRVDLVVDGGPCDVGVESTVVRPTDRGLELLRPGGISREQLSHFGDVIEPQQCGVLRSPGLLEKHYSPDAKTVWATPGDDVAVFIGRAADGRSATAKWIEMPDDSAAYAKQLYDVLRLAEAIASDRGGAIGVARVPDDASWDAIRDRLNRAVSRSSQT